MTQAVAVAGAGLTGAGWAALFAAHGLETRLCDRDPEALARAALRAPLAARFLAEQGLAEGTACETGVAALTTHTDAAAAFAGVALVQECVAEDLAAGVEAEVGDVGVERLSAARDTALAALLRARRGA